MKKPSIVIPSLSVDFLLLQTRPKFAVWGGFRFHSTVPRPYLIPRNTGRLPATHALLFSQPYRFAEFLPGEALVFVEGVAVDVQSSAWLGMAQQVGHRAHVNSLGNQHTGICVPLRYNKDKRKNPVFSRVSAFVVAYSIPFPTLIVNEKSVE